ncbi:protein ROS1A-like [Gastrolobium bilobum]|uniref:protein ROS1A-like n=1 Tax=Gastrolobium bilobum TaxID=150636 RepID=UPI002AB17D3B|nr:protein ROS1A-like [Gastrolobium bilobum]
MEVGEMDRKETQTEVPWIPTTPAKPILPKPVPIYSPGEGNQLDHCANGTVACFEFSPGVEKNRTPHDGSAPAATVANIAGDNSKTCDNVSSWSNLSFSELLFLADAASANSNTTLPGNDDGLKNPFIPSINHDNTRDPHGSFDTETLDIACCSKRTSQHTPLAPDNAIRAESKQIASMQVNMEENDPGGEEKNVPARNVDNNGTLPNKELCDPVIEFATVSSPFKENHNLVKGSSHDIDLNKIQQKPRRRKHRPKVIIEGKPKRTRKPVTPKHIQSKENPTGKRKYVRRKGLTKTSTPPTEVTGELTKEMSQPAKVSCRRSLNFDLGARDESFAGRENETANLGKENGVVVQDTNVGLAYIYTSTKLASDGYMSLPEDPQAPNTSPSRSKPPGAKPKENPTGKRKYVRRKRLNNASAPPTETTGELTREIMPGSAKVSCRRSLNFDKEARGESSAVKENATMHLDKEIDVVAQEMNDLNTSITQAPNSYMSLPEDAQAPNISHSRRNPPEAKPKENPTGMRKYARRKGLNNTSAPPTEVTEMMPMFSNFDKGARDKNSADKENATVHVGKEVGVVAQEMNVGCAYYLNTYTKQASNNYMSPPNDTQAPRTSPLKSNPPGEKPEEIPTGKRKYVRAKGLNNSSTTTEMTRELTEAITPESNKMSWRRSLNSDVGKRDESSAGRENLNVYIGKENTVVIEDTHVDLGSDQNTRMKLALNKYMSVPEDIQASGTSSKRDLPGAKSKENPTGKRKYVRRKGLTKTSTPTETSRELTEPIMCESTKISCKSLNFDKEARDERNEGGESLSHDQNSLVKQALYNYMSSEDKQAPSTSLLKSNPPGAKLNANSVENKNKRKGQETAQDGNISSSQISTIRSQTVGSKRKRSSTTKRADKSSLNLNGAQYNGLPSYQTKFSVQFPNIQKKRRTEKGKTSDTYITSSVTTTKEVQLTCPQEDAPARPYASSSSCWIYSSGCSAARVPAISESAASVIHNTQISDEFIFVRRLRECSISSTQICGCGSLTRIRNCDTESNYTAKQLGISDRLTFGDAERPQKCMDALVADMHASFTKKQRSRKKSALSNSASSSTNEMQQHHNFVLENYHLPLVKSLDMASGVIWKTMEDVDALAERIRQLNINRETRGLVLHQQNALVPYKQENQNQSSLVRGDGIIIPFQGSFDPIKKQQPRPKVDLDEETDRVWKLLMLDINSHGIDGTDEDKAKWWEKERNVFRGRADSFIARMHLVQGDRQFSQWKGSVVDSVVGVFLTQNVSDHLSSSAFMSVAARYPQKSSSMCKEYHGEGTNLVVDKPQVHIVEPEENTEWDVKVLNQPVYDQSSMTVDTIDHSEEKEAVNSNDSCRTASSLVSLMDESNCRPSESAQINTKEHHSPTRSGLITTMTEEGEEKSSFEDVTKELNEIVSSQCSVISSQISGDISNYQNPEKIGSCSDSNSEVEDLSSTAKFNRFYKSSSVSKLLEMGSPAKLHEINSQRSKSSGNLRESYDQSAGMKHDSPTESLKKSIVTQGSLEASSIPSHEYTLKPTPHSGVLEVNCFDPLKTQASSSGFLKKKDENEMNRPSFQTRESAGQVATTHYQSIVSQVHPLEQSNHMQHSFFNISGQTQDLLRKEGGSELGDHKDAVGNETNEKSSSPVKLKNRGQGNDKKDDFKVNWDNLRIKAEAKAGKREKTGNTMDSLDWEAVRCADVSEIANVIKERGMNNRLAERIKNFLNRLVEEHGGIDLEWLRDVPPDQAKEYLLSIRGLGLKSVECVRLLTLHHLAFPVDTNVGRIAVRLGWVPLRPLPESLQLHLLELYPVLESIQKYLWPRLCKLDQRTLYELHYQMITFGKVFCTKSKPNCNACPMRGECRHFASAFASARLALPGPEQRSIVSTAGNNVTDHNPSVIISHLYLPLPENTNQVEEIQQKELSKQLGSKSKSEINICQPIIEEPTTPEPECSQLSQKDIEDAFYEDLCGIPTIKLDIEEFTLNLQNYMQENMELQEGEMSKALVALNPEAASIPMPKLKNVSQLRTEHCVYELPDTHPLLEGWDTREPDDPGKYLLAIWTPGETADSIQPPESKCSSQECGQLCNENECFSCNSFREANSQIVRGTLLIPCRTAMRGSFPLNGTYFQVNEVFADHDSSLNPISVPRSWIWNLNRRTVYFGTSMPTIFKGLSTQDIQQCFWRGYVCVRGFDRGSRAPRPLMARLHFPVSKMTKYREKTRKEATSAKSKRKKLNPNPEHPELISNSHNLQESGRA